MKDPRTSKPGTIQRTIADHCEAGKTKRETYALLIPRVRSGEMQFMRNVPGGRIPKPESEQIQELKNAIGRIYSYLGRSEGSRFEDEEIPQESGQENEQENEQESEESETKTKPEAKGKKSLRDEWAYFKRRIHEIRRFCVERARLAESVDDISVRPMREAARLIAAGIPADVLLLSMAMHWSPDTRRDAGIDDFDFYGDGMFKSHPGMVEVSERVMREREISQHGKHILFGYILLLIEARVPVLLIGPPGTGKSHIAKQISEYLEYGYGETSLSAGATRSDLLGRHTINPEKPWIPAIHTEQFANGGIHLFDEIDRADPGTTIVLNNALASDEMFNSIDGERYEKSETYAPVGAANTMGLGANRSITSAERMDGATIDRFRMGRVFQIGRAHV